MGFFFRLRLMTVTFIIGASMSLAWTARQRCCSSTASSFIGRDEQQSQHSRTSNIAGNHQCSSALMMYFDDISRYAQQRWDPFALYTSGSSDGLSNQFTRQQQAKRYNEEKQEAIKKLLGYTSVESTSHLSDDQGRKICTNGSVVHFFW